MSENSLDSLGTRSALNVNGKAYYYYSLRAAEEAGVLYARYQRPPAVSGEHADEEESLTVAHDEKVLGTADYLAPEQAPHPFVGCCCLVRRNDVHQLMVHQQVEPFVG